MYRSLQQIFRWLVNEDEIHDSPMARMRPPAVHDDPPPVLRTEELERLLVACAGTSSFVGGTAATQHLAVQVGIPCQRVLEIRLTKPSVRPALSAMSSSVHERCGSMSNHRTVQFRRNRDCVIAGQLTQPWVSEVAFGSALCGISAFRRGLSPAAAAAAKTKSCRGPVVHHRR